MKKPLLSIGIIFKNEIRCLERCLRSLQPLRETIPCELVMADTGSDDGSRAVAERYTDILFDFPWVNDFSAARNAVMDRCSGKWYFSVDADEWLDSDISGLVQFLKNCKTPVDVATLVIRNYHGYETGSSYTDFMGPRLLDMSTGLRYQGVIHERWEPEKGTLLRAGALTQTILHHDGYVGLYGEQGKEKIHRNLELLQKQLELEPENMFTWLQLIESGLHQSNIIELLEKGIAMVEEKKAGWEKLGPPVYRYAVAVASDKGLPELDTWIHRARELFPDSLYTRIDVEFIAAARCWNQGDYAGCIESGARYLRALEEYHTGQFDCTIQMYSTIQLAIPKKEQELKLLMACSCTQEDQPERAFQLLDGLDFSLLDDGQTGICVEALLDIQRKTELDTSRIALALWNGLVTPKPSQEMADLRKKAFVKCASAVFVKAEREKEMASANFHRHGYTFLAPLEDKLEMGRAAVILSMNDPQSLNKKLAKVDDWNQFPIHALDHALRCGAAFPPVGKPINVEEMDLLAKRLLHADEHFIQWIVGSDALVIDRGPQSLCWARSLILSAVKSFGWAGNESDIMVGLSLARAFSRVEKEFLSLCYAPGVLAEEYLFLLPPLHRFGWYCAQAFTALDNDDVTNYVRLLRKGLSICESMKAMVEFLTKYTPELQAPPPSAELLALAEQIRTVLANFAADDPAVTALKQSEAYQKAAYLIEGAAVPIVGGLVQ